MSTAADYHAQFGSSVGPSRPMGHDVDLFFANGGSSATVVRVEGSRLIEGVHALETTDCTVLVVPGLTTRDTDQVTAALECCAAYSAVLLLDLPDGPWISAQHDLAAITEHRDRLALYHPWVVVQGTRLPPTGAVAGVLARTDRERGVWKAPAGTAAALQGIDALAEAVDQEVGDAMAVAGVNVLREFAVTGVLVWGARTLASATTTEPHARYLPVRRLLDHVARSVGASLGADTLESNDAGLWARVRVAVEGFLHELWCQGALQGSRPEEAYYVRCGHGQNMTDADLVEGRLVVEWGLAAMKPAEFVVQRVSLATGTLATGTLATGTLATGTLATGTLGDEALVRPRDLGQVASKHLAETEQNLSRILERAERAGAVLHIDEADALFGKRTEIRDSHDRFATLEARGVTPRRVGKDRGSEADGKNEESLGDEPPAES